MHSHSDPMRDVNAEPYAEPWQHSHSFGQDVKRPGESRTIFVIVITAVMMVVEVTAGAVFGSMALLADGLHMASHAVALGINAFAYIYARKHAHDARYSFGTGKVNTLGGYTGAVLLAGFSLVMAWESVARFFAPTAIAFNEAIFVAVIGLIVNGVSVLILGEHRHPESHEDLPEELEEHAHYHDEHYHHHDHNLISAYLHVLADALTSLLAIFALLAAKYFGLVWADPAMGVVGAVLVGRWSIGLLRTTSVVLLDREGPDELRGVIKRRIEAHEGNRVTDLHVWAVGPRLYSAVVGVAADDPKPPDFYKRLLPTGLDIVHLVVEVHATATATAEAEGQGAVARGG
jgi:cation diffusion facilitator family transporter